MSYFDVKREFLIEQYRQTMPNAFQLAWDAIAKAGYEPPVIAQALREHLVNILKPEMEQHSSEMAEVVPPILRQLLEEWLTAHERNISS